jgi:hypothetical protein
MVLYNASHSVFLNYLGSMLLRSRNLCDCLHSQ